MQVLSPYGKNVLTELKTIYGFDSVESVAEFVMRHVQQQYRLQTVSVEMLHIAFGLVAKLVADGETYYLKFASHSMHDRPEQLFPWLDCARKQNLPIPEVIPAANGAWYLSPLENINSDYDVVYLMRRIPGSPMQQASESLLRQYAEVMAQFHRVGFEYPHPVLGSNATWQGKWNNRHELWRNFQDRRLISQSLVTEAMQLIEETKPLNLPKTIVHGDFRLCHVFFVNGSLSGLIDADQSTQGERFIDLCYGLVSGSSPEGGSLLSFEQLQKTLSIYHSCLPLNEAERAILKAAFAYALLETLGDLCEAKGADRDINATQELLETILKASPEELLAGV